MLNLPAPEDRPISFSFNGGPGSSSVWLHLGIFGPKRIDYADDMGNQGPPPHRLRDNDVTARKELALKLTQAYDHNIFNRQEQQLADDILRVLLRGSHTVLRTLIAQGFAWAAKIFGYDSADDAQGGGNF